MKKILSLLLVGIMVVSMVPTAFATTNYTNGTQVSYNADTIDADGDGVADNQEAYTVTVPALLAPEGSGNVVAQGTWSSARKLVVTADTIVTLTNSINSADKKELTVAFPGIALKGSNTAAVTDTKVVSVGAITDALFGTWSGTFNYNVEMVDNVELITFTIDGVEYQAEEGMTWAQFIESEYNNYNDDLAVSEEGEFADYTTIATRTGVICDAQTPTKGVAADDAIQNGNAYVLTSPADLDYMQ